MHSSQDVCILFLYEYARIRHTIGIIDTLFNLFSHDPIEFFIALIFNATSRQFLRVSAELN